jgi:hypothetical protein
MNSLPSDRRVIWCQLMIPATLIEVAGETIHVRRFLRIPSGKLLHN